MPPKKASAGGGASKKAEAKKKDKIIEVRLGLKNSTIQCEIMFLCLLFFLKSSTI